jgi:hypothetical protein
MKKILLVTFIILLVNNFRAQAEEIFLNCSVEGTKFQILPNSMPEEKLYRTDISVQITKVGNFRSIIISGPDIFINSVGTKKLYPEDIIEDYSTDQNFNIRNKRKHHDGTMDRTNVSHIELNRMTGQISSSSESIYAIPDNSPLAQKVSYSGLCSKASNRKF